MLIYAVMTGAIGDLEACREAQARNVLASYVVFGPTRRRRQTWRDEFLKVPVANLLVDSGAFSAHTRGVRIDLKDYYKVIEILQPTRYAALDVIGDAEGTKRNLRRMERDGFRPVPVFTRGAPKADLIDLLDRGYDDIAIGNLVGRQSKEHKDSVTRTLDLVFSILHDRGDESRVKIHGFGVTNVERLLRYPFYSVDSSTGMMSGGMGVRYDLEGLKLKGHNVSNDESGARRSPHLTHHSGASRSEVRMRRMIHNMTEVQLLAKRVTRVWESRGITWPSSPVWSEAIARTGEGAQVAAGSP